MPPSPKKSTTLSQTLSRIPKMSPKKSQIKGLTTGQTTYTVVTYTKLVTANTAEARNPPITAAAAAIIAVAIPSSTMILLDTEDATG